jgi:hypothetical protein
VVFYRVVEVLCCVFVASPRSSKNSQNSSMVSTNAGKEMAVCHGWLGSGGSLGSHL